MEGNAHSAQGTCLLLNRSNFEAFFLLKRFGKINARGGRRKLLLLKGCVRCFYLGLCKIKTHLLWPLCFPGWQWQC